MKKTTKSLLITSAFVFGIGVLLTLVSLIVIKVKAINPFEDPGHVRSIETRDILIQDVFSSSEEKSALVTPEIPFNKLSVRTFTGNVVVETTEEESYISLSHADTANLSIQIVGETLEIKEIDAVSFFGIFIDESGFHFKGIRQFLAGGNSLNADKTIVVHIKQGTELQGLDLQTTIGGVKVKGIVSTSMNLENTSGAI